MWLSLPSRSTLNRDMVTEQCPVWITRTDRFYSHSAIQKQCQILSPASGREKSPAPPPLGMQPLIHAHKKRTIMVH